MISVCMASHNGERYIKEQLDSILCQLDEDDEVIISDDGSTDSTLSILNEMKDDRIKVFRFTQPFYSQYAHEYVCRNFENALIHASGDIIFLSDQDDIWMPNKVEVCLNDLNTYDLVLHDFKHIDENGRVVKQLHYAGTFRRKNFLMLRGLHFGCAMAFRKRVLDYVLPFPEHLMLHDYWIGILSEFIGEFYFEKRPLLEYRLHSTNTSVNKNTFLFKISYRVRCFILVMHRIIYYRVYHSTRDRF